MDLKFKRRYLSYVSYAVLFGLFANALRNFNPESMRIMDYLVIAGLLFAVSSLLWSLFHPYFMIVNDRVITIYDEFFKVKKVPIGEIKRVDETVGITSKTVFEMNDGRKVKFVTSNLKGQDLKKLVGFLAKMKDDVESQTD